MDTQQEDDVYSNSTQQLRNVLVACKLDVSDRQLLNYGCALTCACDATLHLLHVTKQNATNEQIDDSARKGRAELERALPPELVMDTDVRWEVRSGNPAQEFIQYAHENDVDMIIVGSQKHARLGSLFVHHLAADLMKRQWCPVVIVPLVRLNESPSLKRIAEVLHAEFGDAVSGGRSSTESRMRSFLQARFQLATPSADACLEDLEANGVLTWQKSATAEDDSDQVSRCVIDADAPIDTHGATAGFKEADAANATPPAIDLLQRAVKLRATDVHIDPSGTEEEYSVRMRIDGRLQHYCNLDGDLARHHIQQYKVLAGVRISEPFAPHEGSLELPGNGLDCHVRLTSSPVAGGESMCLRLQSKSSIVRPLESLGLSVDNQIVVDRILSRGEGLVLITGPTASGKTTSVYSMLNSLCSTSLDRNVVTIEDPVEFNLPFLRQMSVDETHGLSLAMGLRTMLRMDPDVVFVGEIRDADTAQTAMRAASSGKYVFSTLHTRDVASTVTALLDLGVDPRSLAGNLTGVVSQRLLRRLCKQCAESVAPTEAEREWMRENGVEPSEQVLTARGCRHCHSTGYYGRVGVFEAVSSSSAVIDAIQQNRSERELCEAIRGEGTQSLMSDALGKVVDGITSIQEVQDMTRIL